MDKTRFLSIIKVVWLLAVVAGGIYYFAKNYAVAVDYIQTINILRLVISLLLIIAMRTLHPYLVQRSLALVEQDLDFKHVFSIVSISQLGKYIPGGIWQFVARFTAYRENQISYKDMGKSFIIENVWLVLGSLLAGVCFIFLGQPAFLLQQSSASSIPNILLIVGFSSLFLWVLALFAIEYGVKTEHRKPSSFAVLKQFASQTSMWLFLGLSFSCLSSNFAAPNNILFTAGVFVLSFLAGYIAIFAPGGIGIREYVVVLLLSSVFLDSEIGIVAIVHRLLYTIAEFLLAGISFLLIRKKRLSGDKLGINPVQEEQLNDI